MVLLCFHEFCIRIIKCDSVTACDSLMVPGEGMARATLSAVGCGNLRIPPKTWGEEDGQRETKVEGGEGTTSTGMVLLSWV